MTTLPIPLIVIEGADGAGTTTQARILADKLSVGAPCILTRQPSDGPIGRQIRDMLTGKAPPLASQSAFQLMFTADRLDHAERVILPAAKDGSIIVSDRYDLSTAIYLAASEPHYRCYVEGCGWSGNDMPVHSGFKSVYAHLPGTVFHDHQVENRELHLLRQAFAWNKVAPRPLVTIVLAVDHAVAAARRAARGGKAEMFEQEEFQRRVCGLYSEAIYTYHRGQAAESDPANGDMRLAHRIHVVNGSASEGAVAADVERIAVEAIGKLAAARTAEQNARR